MQTITEDTHPELTADSEVVTKVEARQGQKIKGMWIVLSGGMALAVALIALAVVPFGG